MKIKKFNLPDMYLELADGTSDWYIGLHFTEDICDLYEAEEMKKEGKIFVGNCPYFIHYPEGKVYQPFACEKDMYYETPVWDRNHFGILAVDFAKNEIILFTYVPGENPKILHQLSLDEVEDCYNLKLEMSPWTLGRQTSEEYQMIWPEKKVFAFHGDESLICRDGDVLYLSRWEEEPFYKEYVVTVDIATGKELEVTEGGLYLMPDGTLWNV